MVGKNVRIDKDPPPSWMARISPMIQSSQICSNHDAKIKGSYLGGQVKEAIIKELPYWRLDYKYHHHDLIQVTQSNPRLLHFELSPFP